MRNRIWIIIYNTIRLSFMGNDVLSISFHFYCPIWIYVGKVKSSRPSLQPMWNFGQTAMAPWTFFFRSPPSPRRVTSGIVPIPPGPSQCPYTKTLFQDNSYESVYGLARLHTNLHNKVPIPPGPSQCPYTKTLFQDNFYESVYGLAWLHTNLHTIN